MGLLTERGPPDWHPATDDIKSECRKAADYCQVDHKRSLFILRHESLLTLALQVIVRVSIHQICFISLHSGTFMDDINPKKSLFKSRCVRVLEDLASLRN